MKVSLVCIAKNEERYIEEWVSYHRLLGFDRIFIYDNGNDWSFSKETQSVRDSKDVQIIPWVGHANQHRAYANFFVEYRNHYDWAVIIDCDEFIVLKKNKSIQEFIEQYNQGYDSIALIWQFFGSNGLDAPENGNYSVLERFTKRQSHSHGKSWHIKPCINLKYHGIIGMTTVHNTNLLSVDTSGKTFHGPRAPYEETAPNDVVQLNHYFTKSKEEFMQKVLRGRADSRDKRSFDQFYTHDLNDVEDLFALDFYRKNKP